MHSQEAEETLAAEEESPPPPRGEGAQRVEVVYLPEAHGSARVVDVMAVEVLRRHHHLSEVAEDVKVVVAEFHCLHPSQTLAAATAAAAAAFFPILIPLIFFVSTSTLKDASPLDATIRACIVVLLPRNPKSAR